MEPGDNHAVAVRLESGSSGTPLAPEIHRSSCRRLAWVGLCYSIGYVLGYGHYWFQVLTHNLARPTVVSMVVASFAITFGVLVFLRTRRCMPTTDHRCRGPRHVPRVAYANLAITFEVVGALGIIGGYWGWEHNLAANLQRAGTALGIEASMFQVDFVDRLVAGNAPWFEFLGASWVGVWIMFFPLMVPSPPRRNVVATLLAATTVPLVLFTSLLVNGQPEVVRPWIAQFLGGMIVPTYICAALAIVASRIVYRLTHDLTKARQLGGYRLIEKLGEGGMGEVWRARHRMLVRPAAIKLIRPEALGVGGDLAHDVALRRFEREAQATAALKSAHTIDLYDFGVTDDGEFYYVMELLEGVDIRTLVEKHGPVAPSRVVCLLRQVCDSLAESHAVGLIHRDVKPANIFVCRHGLDFDFIKVLDFGLVKNVDDETRDTQLTSAGVATGTPAFMAPEMACGSAIDARSDIYSLGCVAYWLTTGSLVFEAPTPMAMVLQHTNETPVPPSLRTEMDVPRPLEQVILDCLAKQPNERPRTVLELSQRLGECETSTGVWTQHQAARWWGIYHPSMAPSTMMSYSARAPEKAIVHSIAGRECQESNHEVSQGNPLPTAAPRPPHGSRQP